MSAPLPASMHQRLRQRYQLRGDERPRPSPSTAGGVASTSMPNRASAQLAAAGAPATAATAIEFGGPPPFAVQMLGKLRYGATQLSIRQFNALGDDDRQRLANYVDWQLDWRQVEDGALLRRQAGAGYQALDKSQVSLTREYGSHNGLGRQLLPAEEVRRDRYVRAAFSNRQLHEVLVGFWHDHFNIIANRPTSPTYPYFDRAVIRANATGNFRNMLEAVARSTSMLLYLDNVDNGRVQGRVNENWARELLELHTLGEESYLGLVDPAQVPACPEDPRFPSGFTDIDVYETAAAFSGWSIHRAGSKMGSFRYIDEWHDPREKWMLGSLIPANQPRLKDGRDVLDRLAQHPYAARHICHKLARHFIADDPPQSVVESSAQVFRQYWQHPQQLEYVLRHMLNSNEFIDSWGMKTRRPFELVVAAIRLIPLSSNWTLRLDDHHSDLFTSLALDTGQLPHRWPAPNGYPDIQAAWAGNTSMVMTWRMLMWLCFARNGPHYLSPLLSSSNRIKNPTATRLVDIWSRQLLGKRIHPQRRDLLIRFMAQNADAKQVLVLDNQAHPLNKHRHYTADRLRYMVAMLLMSPEFMVR